MNIKQLRYVVSVIGYGSFSAAAARESVSVQAVSKAMSELEYECGAPLFERRSSGVVPTSFGRSFGARAGRLVEEFDALESFAHGQGLEDCPRDVLRVGFCCPRLPGIDSMASLTKSIVERTLGREAEVVFTDGTVCIDELKAGKYSVLITVGNVHEDGIVTGSLGGMNPYVVVGCENPLAQKPEVAFNDLVGRPVVLSEKFDFFNDSVCRSYEARGLDAEYIVVRTHDELHDVMHRRGGVTFIVGGNFLQDFPDAVIRPIAAADRIQIPICLSSLPGSDVSYPDLRRALSEMKLLS